MKKNLRPYIYFDLLECCCVLSFASQSKCRDSKPREVVEIKMNDLDKSSIISDRATPATPVLLESPDPETSKRLVRKLDFIVLPLLAIIYFTHSLDRANLGNAKTNDFEKDIGLKDNQYSLILILFYIPYGT